MGLEAYLFYVQFECPIPESNIINVFEKAGMVHLSKDKQGSFRSFYFECRTEHGLTECHCLLPPEERELTQCSLRFSLLSPSTIIEQTFQILSHLDNMTPIRVFDTEIRDHIYRKLRRDGEVDTWFKGIEGTPKEKDIHKRSYIPIDVELFNMNQFGIRKREVVLNNKNGDVIESGDTTIRQIEKKGEFNRYLGWIIQEI